MTNLEIMFAIYLCFQPAFLALHYLNRVRLSDVRDKEEHYRSEIGILRTNAVTMRSNFENALRERDIARCELAKIKHQQELDAQPGQEIADAKN